MHQGAASNKVALYFINAMIVNIMVDLAGTNLPCPYTTDAKTTNIFLPYVLKCHNYRYERVLIHLQQHLRI